MKKIQSYNKILYLGSAYTDKALIGDVIIQEKVDGSQFRFGINTNKELVIGSKRCILGHPDENKLFKLGVAYVQSIESKLRVWANTLGYPIYCYGEFLQKPKHNVLSYSRTPKNNIVLFDVVVGGKYLPRNELVNISIDLNIDVIPELLHGHATVDTIKELLTKESYLGNESIEGVVIKNHNQTVLIGGRLFPLFTKYVRESFKERHGIDWKNKNPRNNIESFITNFKNTARWDKAAIHLQEKGLLTNTVKDIGQLITEVQKDIEEEELENIKTFLYNIYIKDIKRTAVKGLPQWYKDKLLKNLAGVQNEKEI